MGKNIFRVHHLYFQQRNFIGRDVNTVDLLPEFNQVPVVSFRDQLAASLFCDYIDNTAIVSRRSHNHLTPIGQQVTYNSICRCTTLSSQSNVVEHTFPHVGLWSSLNDSLCSIVLSLLYIQSN